MGWVPSGYSALLPYRFRVAAMNESEWLTSDDPNMMLCSIQDKVGLSSRKLWLFIVALERLWWQGRGRKSVDIQQSRSLQLLEAVADGRIGIDYALRRVNLSYRLGTSAYSSAMECLRIHNSRGDQSLWAGLLREILGNPLSSLAVYEPVILNPTILSLAEAAYMERLPDRWIDPTRLSILGDALEDAGCLDSGLLSHLHLRCDRVPHVKGCWALDKILSKS